MASAQQPHRPVQQKPQFCNYLFLTQNIPAILESAPKHSFTPQSCLALRKFINSAVSSPNGEVDKVVYKDALKIMGSAESLRSLAIANRRNHEASEQLKRQELFMQQERLSSRIGGAFISFFPIKLLQHISSYLHAPSRALFAVALGNFDMSSISGRDFAPTKESSTASVIKRRKISEGPPLPQRASCGLGDVPMEALRHVASFLAAPSQVIFGLHVAASKDMLLNKSSFAIAGQQSWDTLDFGEIEKDVAWRLTDDDIKAVLWCIDAGNRVKRLRLTNCINITGSGLEPLTGSEEIEQIDMSLVRDHEEPIPLETWHPPLCLSSRQSDPPVCFQIDPLLSRDHVLPVLDSIISREGCSLKHLQFPKGVHRLSSSSWEGYQKMADSIYHEWLPHPLFAGFLTRYTEYMMSRGISCAKCDRNLPSNGYQWFGNDRKLGFNFFNQNHTCSKCLINYCYRCNDDDAEQQAYSRSNTDTGVFGSDDRVLERCKKCEREYCIECSDMFQCWGCGCGNGYFCKDCKASVECSSSKCGNKCCEDCCMESCRKCEKKYCSRCCDRCWCCDEYICLGCDETWEVCQAEECYNQMVCEQCASECQKCKRLFCGCFSCSKSCPCCQQHFCNDCDDFRECEGRNCWDGRQCSGCDEKGPKGLADFNFVSRCESCDRDLCGNCRLDPSHQHNPMNCAGCTRLLNDILGIHI